MARFADSLAARVALGVGEVAMASALIEALLLILTVVGADPLPCGQADPGVDVVSRAASAASVTLSELATWAEVVAVVGLISPRATS